MTDDHIMPPWSIIDEPKREKNNMQKNKKKKKERTSTKL